MNEKGRIQSSCEQFLDALFAELPNFSLKELMEDIRTRIILYKLETKRGNKVRTARELGIHRNTLGRNIQKLVAVGRIEPGTRHGRPADRKRMSA
jgi:DNA-binding NtrC family response regulator